MIRKKTLWGLLYAAAITVFTAYVLLDTFIITRVYAEAENSVLSTDTSTTVLSGSNITKSTPSAADTGNSPSSDVDIKTDISPSSCGTVSTDSYYEDDNIRITLSTYRAFDTDVYVADVTLSSPEYLRTALAHGSYGKNVKAATSEIASEAGAILAINGDFYGARESGYVIRGGIVYRAKSASDQEDLVIYEDGSFGIINESEISADELLAQGAVDVFSFGPALVNDSEIAVSANEEVGRAKSSNQRTAIAIVGEGHYLFVVSDGRTEESEGLSLSEFAEVLQSLGAETAYNLDGGGSSTMVFQGKVVNNPTTSGKSIKERSVSDIVYIGQ